MVKEREGDIVRRVVLVDDHGDEVVPVNRFLSHLVDAGYSPNTVCAYGYNLRHLAQFLADRSLGWNDFRPATALEFLGYLRRVPSRRPAQRLGLTVATEQGRLLCTDMPMCGRVDKPWNDLGLIATMAQVLVGRKGRLPKIRQGGCAS